MDVMSLVSGISQTVGIYKTAVETLDDAKITAATNELAAQLIHLGAEVLAMQKDGLQSTERERTALGRIHNLEDQIRELEKRISERERYDLVEDYPGTFTLKVKEARRNGDPVHHLCPACMDNRSLKSIIQFNSPSKIVGTCYECSKNYRFAENIPINWDALQRSERF